MQRALLVSMLATGLLAPGCATGGGNLHGAHREVTMMVVLAAIAVGTVAAVAADTGDSRPPTSSAPAPGVVPVQ